MIFDLRTGKIISRGCSHKRPTLLPRNTVHAEEMALASVRPEGTLGCMIVTLTKGGHYARSSKPCASCVRILKAKGVSTVFWPSSQSEGLTEALVADLVPEALEIELSPWGKSMVLAT